jgi:hypothetical protein
MSNSIAAGIRIKCDASILKCKNVKGDIDDFYGGLGGGFIHCGDAVFQPWNGSMGFTGAEHFPVGSSDGVVHFVVGCFFTLEIGKRLRPLLEGRNSRTGVRDRWTGFAGEETLPIGIEQNEMELAAL